MSAVQLLTVEEFCAWLQVSRTKLHHLRKGDFPNSLHIGAAVRWRREDIDAWLSAKAVTP
jgi:predicted DNA-binding transcriptional regulator AlpA